MPKEQDFIELFKVEAEGYLTKLDNGLVELENQPDNDGLITELNRAAHTLKGSSRMFNFLEIQEISHRIENIFVGIIQKKITFSSLIADSIFNAVDVIRKILKGILTEEKSGVVSAACRKLDESLLSQPSLKKESAENFTYDVEPPIHRDGSVTSKEHEPIQEYVQVPLNRINNLFNLVGMLMINKTGNSAKLDQIKKLLKIVKETETELSFISDKIKKDTLFQNRDVKNTLGKCDANIEKLKEISTLLHNNISSEAFCLDPIIDELQNNIKQIRMITCSTTFEGFPRMIRDIAAQENKLIDLKISGKETELDKNILDGIKASLMHILRNCVDHGIEAPDVRKNLNKPKTGTIYLEAFHDAGNIVITIEDDGKGIDINEIKTVALNKKLVSEKDLSQMPDESILNLVMMDGLSTSPIITDISGRGVGLNVAKHDISNLNGQIFIKTEKNKGTKFTIILPRTLAIIHVLLIKEYGKFLAIPTASVSESLKVDVKNISTIEGKMAIQVRDQIIPVVRLGKALSLPLETDNEQDRKGRQKINESVFVIIISSLNKKVGFIVDKIVNEKEVFVKSISKHHGNVKNIIGATILSSGEVVIILDVIDLIKHSKTFERYPAAVTQEGQPQNNKITNQKRILIVDDSLSTRELE